MNYGVSCWCPDFYLNTHYETLCCVFKMCCISLIYARMHTYVYPHCSKGEMLYFSVSTKDKYSKYFFYRRLSSPFKALSFASGGKKKKANKIWPMWNPGNIVENTRVTTFHENCSDYNTFVYFWGAWVKGFHLFMRKCALCWERCNQNISLIFCRRSVWRYAKEVSWEKWTGTGLSECSLEQCEYYREVSQSF